MTINLGSFMKPLSLRRGGTFDSIAWGGFRLGMGDGRIFPLLCAYGHRDIAGSCIRRPSNIGPPTSSCEKTVRLDEKAH